MNISLFYFNELHVDLQMSLHTALTHSDFVYSYCTMVKKVVCMFVDRHAGTKKKLTYR